jgi:outer membrane lipoprotein-sorting protein
LCISFAGPSKLACRVANEIIYGGMMTVPCCIIKKRDGRVPFITSFFLVAVLLTVSILAITFRPSTASPHDKEFSPAVPVENLDSLSPDDLLALALEQCRSLESYQCRLKLHLTKAGQVQNGEYIFSYKKPNLVRMHVERGKDKGSTVILQADGRIRGRREGILSIFAVTLQPNDQRLYDLWDRSFCNSDWATLLSETKDRLGNGESSNLRIVDNGQKVLLDTSGSDFEEQTWLDSKSLVLLRKKARMNNGDSLDAVWSDIALNPSFDDHFFNF